MEDPVSELEVLLHPLSVDLVGRRLRLRDQFLGRFLHPVIWRLLMFAGIVVVAVACVSAPSNAPTEVTSGMAGKPGATRDPNSPYRTTLEAFLLATKACVEERGFPVTLDVRQAGFRFDLGDDARVAQAREALRICMGEVDPKRLEPPPALSRDQLKSWYAYKLRIRECLVAAGESVPEAPPQSVFVDSGGDWDPFGAMLDEGRAVPPDLQSQCERVDGAPAFLSW